MGWAFLEEFAICIVAPVLLAFSSERRVDVVIGTKFPSPSQDIEAGGDGKGVSSPKGASGGTCPICGYRWTRISRTGWVRQKKHSSMEAFSECFGE